MTANEFYGPELAQMRLAERQVLEAVEELQRVWKAQGRQSPVLYTSSRIKSPESMCRKLAQRGQPQTRQAALTRVRDAVGVRVICGFQDDVYQVARWLEDQAAFSVLETKDYISYPKENGYRSYLPLGRWFRAGVGLAWTGLWIWLAPFVLDQIYLHMGYFTSTPYQLILPIDFHNWAAASRRMDSKDR